MSSFSQEAIQRRLRGIQDPRGKVGMFGRGKPVFRGGATSPHSGGGPQYGRPKGKRDSYKRIRSK